MHLQENTLFDNVLQFRKKIHYLTSDLKVTSKVAQYTLYHTTFAAAKFEATTSDGLGEDAFYMKIHYLTLTVGLRSHKMLPGPLYIM